MAMLFDLYSLFVNQMSGSEIAFIFTSMALVTFICAMFRLPNQAMLIIITFYAILLSAFFSILLPLVLVVGGFFIALAIGRLIRVS